MATDTHDGRDTSHEMVHVMSKDSVRLFMPTMWRVDLPGVSGMSLTWWIDAIRVGAGGTCIRTAMQTAEFELRRNRGLHPTPRDSSNRRGGEHYGSGVP